MRRSPPAPRRNALPLTPEQKKSVVRQVRKKYDPEKDDEAILKMLFDDITENNSSAYPPLLAQMISDLYKPYQYFESRKLKRAYDGVVNDFLDRHGVRLFRECCKSEEGWGSAKIHILAKQFQVKYDDDYTVQFTIQNGKYQWKLLNGVNVVLNQHEFARNTSVLHMTLEDFHELKISGKRNPSRKNRIPKFFRVNDPQLRGDFLREGRSPRKGQNRDHSNTDLCHICTWDVGEYSGLKLHKVASHKLDTEEVNKNRECCGENYPFHLDHIPANSFLGKLGGHYSRDFKNSAYVIAVPERLHEFVSATYKTKALGADFKAQIAAPGTALLKDIGAYLNYFKETEQLSLKILGAFRYLYRKNVKRFNGFCSEDLDRLFLEMIQVFLRNRENTLPDTSTPIARRVGLFQDREISEDSDDSEENSYSSSSQASGSPSE